MESSKLSALLVALCAVLAGCGQAPSKSDETRRAIGVIGLEYHFYCSEKKSAPSSIDDLLVFQNPAGFLPGNELASSEALVALRSGNYVVYWNYDVNADAERNKTVILAYHKDVPKDGGYVVYGDGRRERLTKESFERANKARDFTRATVAD